MRKQVRIDDTNDPLESKTDRVLTSYQPSNTESQEDVNTARYEQISVRKVTFQINEKLLDELIKLHDKLRVELGKEVPYREVLVEVGIDQVIEQLKGKGRDEFLSIAMERQRLREELATARQERRARNR